MEESEGKYEEQTFGVESKRMIRREAFVVESKRLLRRVSVRCEKVTVMHGE